MKKSLNLKFLLLIFSLVVAYGLNAQTVSKPKSGNTGTWKLLGSVQAKFSADHDAISVQGPYDYFRKIKFKVTNAPLDMVRMIVRYDDGAPENIDTRFSIAQGGESRVIDLKGGKRKLKSIEFWYDTKGILNGKAELVLFGMK